MESAIVVADGLGVEVRSLIIPGGCGVGLDSRVFTPAAQEEETRYPLILMPASWGASPIEYARRSRELSASGFVVVAYEPRGFGASGGRVEVGGPGDMADVSALIDWALAHTPSDPDHIGMAGISYGAALSLLGAAADPRISVVAAADGWTDLPTAMYPGGVANRSAATLLTAALLLRGQPDAALARMLLSFFTGTDRGWIRQWAEARSPASFLTKINAQQPAILLSAMWQDSIVGAEQSIGLFRGLTGPSMLVLSSGEHLADTSAGPPEVEGRVWHRMGRWLDHHLNGTDNGVQHEPRLALHVRPANTTEGQASWESIAAGRRRWELGPASCGRPGALRDPATGAAPLEWRAGIPLLAWPFLPDDRGVFAYLVARYLRRTPTAWILPVPNPVSLLWRSAPLREPLQIRGTATLTLTADRRRRATLHCYLYDTGPAGGATLISSAAVDLPGGKRRSQPCTVVFHPTAYDVAVERHLTLVISATNEVGVIPTPSLRGMTFESSPDNPACLELPTR